jgi:hypothetical protein
MAAAILFSSCKKDSPTQSTEYGANSTGTFTATIGGTQWQATKVRAYVQDVFTRFSGSGAISDTSCKFSNVNLSVIIKYVKSPTQLDVGEDIPSKGFYFDATATLDCTLRKGGSNVSYTAEYMLKDNFSSVNVTTYNSTRLVGTIEFRSVYPQTADTVDVRNGAFNITF